MISNFKIYKKINFQIILIFLKFFKKIKIKIIGINVIIKFNKKEILNNLNLIKKNSSFLFKVLVDLVVEDFPKKKKRYFIKYFIRSLTFCKVLQIYLNIKDYNCIFSITNLYKSAYWLEREAWDLYGIFFLFNFDLRRLLTDYGFRGNPLKKDFPLIGFVELYYDFLWKKLKYQKIKVAQKIYVSKTFFKKC